MNTVTALTYVYRLKRGFTGEAHLKINFTPQENAKSSSPTYTHSDIDDTRWQIRTSERNNVSSDLLRLLLVLVEVAGNSFQYNYLEHWNISREPALLYMILVT